MPELPLLSLPAPETIDSPRRGSGGPRLIKPTRGRQAERLDPKFDRLARVVADPAQLMQLRQDPEAIAPETGDSLRRSTDRPAPVRIRELIGNPNVTLARVNEILFIRPQSTATFPLDAEQDDDPAPPQAVERGQCRPLRHYSMVFPSRTTNGCTTGSSSAIPKGSSQPTKWLRASMAPR